jgi:hypothetical protein
MFFEDLILHQRLSRDAEANLHCREITLRLSADCRQLVLTRYNEHYGPALARGIERSHKVSVSELLRWLVANGEEKIVSLGNSSLG